MNPAEERRQQVAALALAILAARRYPDRLEAIATERRVDAALAQRGLDALFAALADEELALLTSAVSYALRTLEDRRAAQPRHPAAVVKPA